MKRKIIVRKAPVAAEKAIQATVNQEMNERRLIFSSNVPSPMEAFGS